MRIAKLISAVAGVLVVLVGLGLTAAGAITLALVDGDDGYVELGPNRIVTGASALVAEGIEVEDPWLGPDLERVATRFVIDDGENIFIGVAPTIDVRRYLTGVDYALVGSWDDEPALIAGSGEGLRVTPATAGLWAASSTTGSLSWDVDEGNWSIVVMNADGSPGVDVEVTAGARVPFLRPLGVVLVVLGVIGIGVGVLLTYFGVRSSPSPATTEPSIPVAP